jgi:hypothetical protein
VSGREEADPLFSFCRGCSESLGSSMKMDSEWPRLAADPVWWTIEGSELSEFGVHLGLSEIESGWLWQRVLS